jgi:tetratricopeptide (TPR) repeat protein
LEVYGRSAIELAAARVRVLAVGQIANRLDDRFNLLNVGSRAAPARHQTLRAMIDWSYGLLSPIEKAVFRSLAVFAGGWKLEAAEDVCASDDSKADQVLGALGHLVDKSLVVVDLPHGEARYRFLETIRQYAAEKLAQIGETHWVRDRHLSYFCRWAANAAPHLDGPEQLIWLDRFEAEHDNLRAALEWSRATDHGAEAGLRLAGAPGLFWRKHGYHSEGRRHLSAALSRVGTQSSSRGHALNQAAMLAYLQSDYPAARLLGEESLALWQGQGSAGKHGVAAALDVLAETATEEGDYATAQAQFEEALAIWRELKHAFGIGDMLVQLGWAAMRVGNYEQAGARLEESLVLFREMEVTGMVALILSGLGELAVRQAQYDRATRLLEESLTLRREQGHKWGMGTSLGTLGLVALCQRDFKRMKALLGESLTMRMEIGHQGGIAWCLEKLAEAACLQGRLETAVKIFGAAAALRVPIGSVIDPVDQADYERLIAKLRSTLGDGAFDASRARGQALPLDNVIDEALAEPDEPTKPAARADKEVSRVDGARA